MIQQSFISIIIPVLNAQAYIGACLEALLSQDYPKYKFEIIVVDNGSSDETLSIVKKYPVKLLTKINCNISSLRNWGAKHAKGDVFAFIDADCIAPSNWLYEASLLLNIENVGAVGCWYALPQSPTNVERVWDIVTFYRRERTGPIDWVPSGDLIIKKENFGRIHGFDEDLITSEDVDFCQRIIKSGKIVYSDPKIAVEHLGNPKTLKTFFLKEKWRGEGVLQNSFKNFPQIEFNNALIFSLISLIFVIGMLLGVVVWILKGSYGMLLKSFIGLLYVPQFLTIKALINRSQWLDFFLLLLLFTIYGVARAASILNPKVWSKQN